jgi:hypothetical protein
MVKYNLILLIKIQLLFGQTQYENLNFTATTKTALTGIITTLSVIRKSTTTTTTITSDWLTYSPTEETTLTFNNNCTYGSVFNGYSCDGKYLLELKYLA